MNHCVKREKNSWLRDTFLRKESIDGNTDKRVSGSATLDKFDFYQPLK